MPVVGSSLPVLDGEPSPAKLARGIDHGKVMSKSGDALKNLLVSWKSLKEHRPAEADFSAYG